MGRLRILMPAPWTKLDRYQHAITRAEFDDLISRVYCPSGALADYLTYSADAVTIHSASSRTSPLFTFRFASAATHHEPSPIRRIALDPGHIGGDWAPLEERWFQRDHDQPIAEAALNLTVARLLKPQLEAAGFTVLLSKDDFQPVTDQRPADFPTPIHFYRHAEIAARTRKLNEQLHPDLTLCLHFNAAPWDDRQNLVTDNRLLLYIHGNYLPSELTDDDQKYCLFAKLLEGSHASEIAIAEALAVALAKATNLPPVGHDATAVRVGPNPYIYARNLAANRLISGPVVYLEPYYMNNRLVYQRLQLGDYAGERAIAGHRYKSIFREYADAVADGLRSKLLL